MRLKYKLILSLSLILVVFVANIGIAQAKDCTVWTLGCDIIPTSCTDNDMKTECGVLDMVTTMIHVAQWLLAVVGAVAFGYFVYGGFIFLTAAGNSSQVDQGRRILIGTVVGLFIILGAFQVVNWVGKLFGGGATPGGYNEFLDTSANQCIHEGDPCKPPGSNQRVYACGASGCSGVSLCAYWADNGGGPYSSLGISADHACENPNDCSSGTIIINICPGVPGNNNTVCCCRAGEDCIPFSGN